HWFRERERYCYAGTVAGPLFAAIPKLLLERESCALHPGMPIYAALAESDEMRLVEMPEKPRAISLQMEPTASSRSLSSVGLGDMPLWLSKDSQDFRYLSVELPEGDGDLVFAFGEHSFWSYGRRGGGLIVTRGSG